MISRTLFCIALLVSLGAEPAAAAPWPKDFPRLERSHEIAMALSAAPADLRARAGVYVLGATGYVNVRQSANGFTCLVERDPNITAPVCYDAEGSRTTLLASLERARLIASGTDPMTADREIDADYRAGRLHAPAKPGIAYMLSTDFVKRDPLTGKTKVLYPPHVMAYAPYMRNADLGVPTRFKHSTTHVWIESEGKPDACIVFPTVSALRF